jgi:hypothetical protein
MPLGRNSALGDLDLHLYDEVTLEVDTDDQTQPVVRIGTLDLFGKVDVSPKFSFVSETMIGMMAVGMAMVHQPRLFMDYKPSDALDMN